MLNKPSNSEFSKIFDSIAPEFDSIINNYAKFRRIEFIKRHARGKCLEVGAGSGEISKALLSNHEVVATDISPKMVDVIRKKLKINTSVCDAEKLPFKDSSFNTVIAAELIYYLDHPESFIKESRRVLTKKGRIIISSASKITEFYNWVRTFFRKIGFASMYFEDPNKKFPSASQIKDLLTKNNFKIKKTEMAIFLPFKSFNPINRFLEKTPLRNLCSFIFICAER